MDLLQGAPNMLVLRAPVLGPLVEGMVFQMRAGDPLVEAAAAMVLLTVGIGAAWVPARRAASLDPMTALRNE